MTVMTLRNPEGQRESVLLDALSSGLTVTIGYGQRVLRLVTPFGDVVGISDVMEGCRQ
jgi:hypothetical protein